VKKTLVLLAALMAVAVPAGALTNYTPVDWDYMSYANGNLNAVGNPAAWVGSGTNSGWAGDAGSEMSVTSGTLKIGSHAGTEPATTYSRWIRGANYPPPSAYVALRFYAKKGEGDSTGWRMFVGVLGEGNYFAKWTGTGTSITCGDGNSPSLTVQLTDEWQAFTAFGSGANVAYYWLGTTYLGQAPSVGNNRVRWITLYSLARSGGASGYAYLDNFSYGYGDTVVPEPSGLLALSALGVGMLGYIRRRR
jgi:hypothetical protein